MSSGGTKNKDKKAADEFEELKVKENVSHVDQESLSQAVQDESKVEKVQ